MSPASISRRPIPGVRTWVSTAPSGGAFTDPRNQAADYTLLRTNRTHVVRTYGSFDLPVGPGKSLAGNSHGVLARVIEGWQTSWIVNLQTGAPLTIGAQNMLYGLGTPDQVRPFDFNGARGVQWPSGANSGLYFGDVFKKIPDPQCAAIDPSLRAVLHSASRRRQIRKYHLAEPTARYARQCRLEHNRRGGSLECGYGSNEEFQSP